jgi:Domain of unknown function (DUF4158)
MKTPPATLLGMVAAQLQVQPAVWEDYAQRDETRCEHLIELQHLYGFQPLTSRKLIDKMGLWACWLIPEMGAEKMIMTELEAPIRCE